MTADSGSELLDQHQTVLRQIEEKARAGYTALGLAILVVPPVSVFLCDLRFFSLSGVGLLLFSFAATLVGGRRVWLADREERLRYAVEAHCEKQGLAVERLVEAARNAGQYEFVVKLFMRPHRD